MAGGRIPRAAQAPGNQAGRDTIAGDPCSRDQVPVRCPVSFFGIAFGFSWLMWLPRVLWPPGPFSLPGLNITMVMLGAFGPSAAAFLLTYREGRREGVLRLGRRALDFKIGFRWLAAILLLPPLLAGLALLIDSLRTGEPLIAPLFAHPFRIVPAFLSTFFLEGPFQEELGWRGYALDRLQARWNPLVSSIVLGTAWGLWHLPLFLMTGVHSYLPLWAFLIWTNSLSVIMTWIYNNTGGNLFTALLFHGMVNLSLELFPLLEMNRGSPQSAFIYLVLLTVAAAGIVSRRRGLLPYRHPDRADAARTGRERSCGPPGE
jgi:membrane protease YdiL (CAAX protease family)